MNLLIKAGLALSFGSLLLISDQAQTFLVPITVVRDGNARLNVLANPSNSFTNFNASYLHLKF